MKVSFHINYPTIWGQTLHLIGSIPTLGNWDTKQAINLEYTEDGIWSANVEVPNDTISFEYKYLLRSNGKEIFETYPENHVAVLESSRNHLLYDTWQNKPEQAAFYTSAFTDVLFARPDNEIRTTLSAQKKIRLKVFAPRIESTQQVAITGNQSILGHWDTNKAIRMSCIRFPEWEAEFDASQLSYPIEFKFIVYNNNKPDVYWEPGQNRTLTIPLLKENETAIISGLLLREEFAHWKCAGTAIPVFSLRSKDSFGIGDFADLKKMVDWVHATGQKVIQILPVNDTTMSHTWMDSYPYNAISIFAIHPIYLNLKQMGQLKDEALAGELSRIQEQLNSLEKLDYELVDLHKWAFFRSIFTQEGAKTLKSKKYKDFFAQNKEWLLPYAAYSYLRDQYQTSDFRNWGNYAVYDPQEINLLCAPESPHHNEISIYYYLQYHLHIQLTEAKAYAKSKKVILKGDIPIGISSTSIEAWKEPRYFNMNKQAGAPPDDFSATGQNWGFPTYNWEEMEKDGYAWWKKRFRHMAHYFDAYRIDHILGFFRIWEIPETSVEALLATFNPALPFSSTEISNAGMHFDEEKHTRAQINGCFLPNLFGAYMQEAGEKYLIRSSSHYFTLHPAYDTQVKIKNHFAGKDDFKSLAIKNALFKITNEVLFIPDEKKENAYHPRIDSGQTFAYRELSPSDKYAFDYLYWDYFYHRQNDFWKEQAFKRLTPLISCTDMLVCGEDLGMIPQSVPEVMNQLQILSLEIERMPKQAHVEFECLKEISYRSVCTTSTHDMQPIRAWWEEDKERSQRYFNSVLQQEGTAPATCSGEICREIIQNHLKSPAMLVILPLQDWMGMDENIRNKDAAGERINIPSNPRHYWGYRMHLNIEDLVQEEHLNTNIRKIVQEAHRA